MADETNEDDSWLYGSSNPEAATADNGDIETNGKDGEHEYNAEQDEQPDGDEVNEGNAEYGGDDDQNGEEAADGSEKEDKRHADGDKDDSDSDDEDDVVVVIGDIKAGSNYNIKQRGNLLAQGPAATQEKPKANQGKFSIEEFESVGTISGQLAHEFSIDSLDEKPWRKPGADITDYFNYGFNEETWRAYCEKQKKMRLHESGVGLQGLAAASSSNSQAGGNNASSRTLTSVTSGENSKYTPSGAPNINNAGPSKFPNRPGVCAAPGRNDTPSKENVIQVMTAERREYSRSKGKFDPSMMQPPPNTFPVVNEPFYPEDNFSYGYEPTQEQQWNNEGAGWAPSAIKELTTGPQMVPPPRINMNIPPPRPMMGPPQMMNMPPMVPPHIGMGMPPQMPIMHPQHGAPVMHNRDRAERSDREERAGADYREHDDKRGAWRSRDKERDYDRSRDRDRERSERGKSEESERSGRNRDEDSPSRDRRRERERSDRYRDRDRSSRRERSRSRERSERRRRSKSRESTRDKDRKSRDKKKSHKKDKDDSD